MSQEEVGEMMIGGDDAQCYLDQDLDENGNVWGKDWMQPEPEQGDQKKDNGDSTKEGQPDWYCLIALK